MAASLQVNASSLNEGNLYGGYLSAFNEYSGASLSKIARIGGKDAAESVRGIEEAFHVADQMLGKYKNAASALEAWFDCDSQSYVGKDAESINFGQCVAEFICDLNTDAELIDEARGLLRAHDWPEYAGAREDIRRYREGYKLDTLVEYVRAVRLVREYASPQIASNGKVLEVPEAVRGYQMGVIPLLMDNQVMRDAFDIDEGARKEEGRGVRNALRLAFAVSHTKLYEQGIDLTLPAFMMRRVLDPNGEFAGIYEDPAEVYLDVREILWRGAVAGERLSNTCTRVLTRPATSRGLPAPKQIDFPGLAVLASSTSLVGYLNELVGTAEVQERHGTVEYIELPVNPAICIQRYTSYDSRRTEKYNGLIEIPQRFQHKKGRWKGVTSGYVHDGCYVLRAAVLHSSDSGRFAIIWESTYSSWHDPKYEFLNSGGSSIAISPGAVKGMIDGDGTGGYNAVLATYHCYGGGTRSASLYAEDFGFDPGDE
jgi:hypothetical protein